MGAPWLRPAEPSSAALTLAQAPWPPLRSRRERRARQDACGRAPRSPGRHREAQLSTTAQPEVPEVRSHGLELGAGGPGWCGRGFLLSSPSCVLMGSSLCAPRVSVSSPLRPEKPGLRDQGPHERPLGRPNPQSITFWGPGIWAPAGELGRHRGAGH